MDTKRIRFADNVCQGCAYAFTWLLVVSLILSCPTGIFFHLAGRGRNRVTISKPKVVGTLKYLADGGNTFRAESFSDFQLQFTG